MLASKLYLCSPFQSSHYKLLLDLHVFLYGVYSQGFATPNKVLHKVFK